MKNTITKLLVKLIVGICLLVAMFLIWKYQHLVFQVVPDSIFSVFISLFLIMLYIVIFILYFFIVFNGFYVIRCIECFDRIGLSNSIGKVPLLIKKKSNGRNLTLTFLSFGIPRKEWEDRKEFIENALDISISTIEFGHTNRMIVIKAYKGIFDWRKDLLFPKSAMINDSTVVLGESVSSKISFNLEKNPHCLIGGATGSGKTYLLKLILYQCILKGYQVYISDFKGGVDYPRIWNARCNITFDENTTLSSLNKITAELQNRLSLFSENQCKDIDAYNSISSTPLTRIVFACDEVAELLDETGLSKEEKQLIKEISARIKTIARLGRAAGIHLILATQRADADVISGQIKSNITYRICGTADSMLSIITLGYGDAAERVPKDIPGVFLNQDGILFKGYKVPDFELF